VSSDGAGDVIADDFLATCREGMEMRTRDRRAARIIRVASDEGLIYGDVAMHGPCAWRVDGRYLQAPAGAAGPLDLVASPAQPACRPQRKTASMKEALAEGSGPMCCD
jgi:hypothetical protein